MDTLQRKINSAVFIFIAFVFVAIYSYAPVYAISQEQINLYKQGILHFDVEQCSETANSQLYGNDNPERIWNYFKTQGLEDIHIAAIMGNLQQESGFNPTIIQGGGTSNDPADAGSGGWGLAQWTPGSKVLTIADEYDVSGNIYELATQLEIIWKEMSNQTPTGYKNFIPDFTAQTTLEDAVEFYSKNFEGAGKPVLENRIAFAQQALATYGNNTGTTAGSSGETTAVSSGAAGCASSTAYISPDCQAATGTAKILCAAKAYDAVSYYMGTEGGHQGGAAWHDSCPTIGADCFLDCSGLVNIALYDVTGGTVDRRGPVADFPSETDRWQKISFSEVQAGDLLVIFRSTGVNHVEIIDHVEGQVLHTFGAHTNTVPQSEQVGPSTYEHKTTYQYYHYIGPGI